MSTMTRITQRPASTVPLLQRQTAEYQPRRRPDDDGRLRSPVKCSSTSAPAAKLPWSSRNALLDLPPSADVMTGLWSSRGAELITVKLIKGKNGFGFTISDTPNGQVVKHVANPSICRQVSPGDVIVAVNGVWVRDRPHSVVVDELRRCARGCTAELTLLTAAPRHHSEEAILYGEENRTYSCDHDDVDKVGSQSGRDKWHQIHHEVNQFSGDRIAPENGDLSSAFVTRDSAAAVSFNGFHSEDSVSLRKEYATIASTFEERLNSALPDATPSKRPGGYDLFENGSNTVSRNGYSYSAENSGLQHCHSTSVSPEEIEFACGNWSIARAKPFDDSVTYERTLLRRNIDANGIDNTLNTALAMTSASKWKHDGSLSSAVSISETGSKQRRNQRESVETSNTSSAQSSPSVTSRAKRIVALVRRPITPSMRRKSKTNEQDIDFEADPEHRVSIAVGDQSIRSPSPFNVNFSGTPDFIPASVYGGAGPFDHIGTYRSRTDDQDSISSSTSASISLAFRPPSSVSGYETAMSASSPSAEANHRNGMKSLSRSFIVAPDVFEHASPSIINENHVHDDSFSPSNCSSIRHHTDIRLPMASTSFTTNDSFTVIDNTTDSTTAMINPRTSGAMELLFAGRELCNGYNVRTETVYSSPHFNQHRLSPSRVRPASTVPHINHVEESGSRRPPPSPLALSAGVNIKESAYSRNRSTSTTSSAANSYGTTSMEVKRQLADRVVSLQNGCVSGTGNLSASKPIEDTKDGWESSRITRSKTTLHNEKATARKLEYDTASAADESLKLPPLPPPSSQTKNSFVYQEIELHRGSRGFGFSIRGGREFNGMPLLVLNIAKSGPADMDGRLMNDDQILMMNGINVDGMSHSDGVDLVQNSCSPLRLLVKRSVDSTVDSVGERPVHYRKELPSVPTYAR